MYLIRWITTHLPTPEGWMAELANCMHNVCQIPDRHRRLRPMSSLLDLATLTTE